MTSITVKNTFLTCACGTSPETPHGARRSRSAPPRRRDGHPEDVFSSEKFEEQLRRLDDILSGTSAPGFTEEKKIRSFVRRSTASTIATSQSSDLEDIVSGTLAPGFTEEKKIRSFVRRSTASTIATSQSSEVEDLGEASKDEESSLGSVGDETACVEATLSAHDFQGPGSEDLQVEAEMQAMLKQIPLDDQGRHTSVGSVGHAERLCKPCVFFNSPLACKFGVVCDFCHFPSGHPVTTKVRFCKGKREHFRKAAADAVSSGNPMEWPARAPLLGRSSEEVAAIFARAAARLNTRAVAVGAGELA